MREKVLFASVAVAVLIPLCFCSGASSKLTGISPYLYSGGYPNALLDGNTNNYAEYNSQYYVQMDFGSVRTVNSGRFMCRTGWTSRMANAEFAGSLDGTN